MAQRSISPDDFVIAWATPVNLVELGARLEAYGQTKSAITTFRLASMHSMLAGRHSLPEEIVSMIASRVRDSASRRKTKKWVKLDLCLSLNCVAHSHYHSDTCIYQAEVDEIHNEAGVFSSEAHQKALGQYCNRLSNLDSSRFARCVHVFTRDFGIRPYFLLSKTYEGRDDESFDDVECVLVKAFLTLPVLSGPISSNPGPSAACISIRKTLDPAAFRVLDEHQQRRFRTAMTALKLRPFIQEEQWEANPKPVDEKAWPQLMILASGEFGAYDDRGPY